MDETAVSVLVQLAPLMLIQLFWSVIIGMYQAKQKRGVVVSVILCLIPFFGAFFILYFNVVTVLRILDRLNALEGKSA